MRRVDMLGVVVVEVGVHPDALAVQGLVILRARQRRQIEELQQIDRQLALDDLDVALRSLRRVGREADDVAGVGDARLIAFQACSMARYSVMLVLLLLGAASGCRG